MQNAELIAGGEFGAVARRAKPFRDTLECDSVPWSTIRKLWRQKPIAFERVADMVGPLVGPSPLHKDFIEALVYLADMGERIDPHRLAEITYPVIIKQMTEYHRRHHAPGRIGKVASPRMKAKALRYVISPGCDLAA